ncbi:MAG: hydrolase TatD, partial [Firmicutes bacterium]|nr:hydrolase TatD [Bacillota bacterium]
MLIDSHCHIQDREFDADREDVLARAKGAGVEYVLAIGSTLSSSRRARDLAQKHSQVFAAVGIHPHNSRDADSGTF